MKNEAAILFPFLHLCSNIFPFLADIVAAGPKISTYVERKYYISAHTHKSNREGGPYTIRAGRVFTQTYAGPAPPPI